MPTVQQPHSTPCDTASTNEPSNPPNPTPLLRDTFLDDPNAQSIVIGWREGVG